MLAATFAATALVQLVPVAFPPVAPGADGAVRVEGRCLYSPELEQQAQGAVLIACGEVVLAQDSVAFAMRGFAEGTRFEGFWDGDDFVIERVVSRGLDGTNAARGRCRVLVSEQRVARVSCTAVAGPRGYVANFVVPLLD